MEPDKKSDKPPKEKKKRASGPKKEKIATHKKSGTKESISAQYFSQSQQPHQLIDSHAGSTQLTQGGHLFTTSISQPSSTVSHLYSAPFTQTAGITLGQSVTTSAPHLITTSTGHLGTTSLSVPSITGHVPTTTTSVRHHTTLPPKKSLSPSRMAAIVEQQRMELAASHDQVAVPATQPNFQTQETPQTTSMHAPQTQPILSVPSERQSMEGLTSEESGGLLRQHLLKKDHKVFSAYQHAPNFSPADGSRESPSPRAQNTSHQSRQEIHREEIRGHGRGQPIQISNINLAAYAQLKKEHEDTQGHPLGLLESDPINLQRALGNIQLQKIIIPSGGENIRRIGSPGKKELHSYAQQILKTEHGLSPMSHQVSTIRRTPSPAHTSERRSPVPSHGTAHEQGERSQPVNLSTHEPYKKVSTSITTAQSHMTGSVVMSPYHSHKPKHRTGKDQHYSKQEDFSKIRDPGETSLPQGESSISIPSKIMSTVQSAGKMQTEILKQTLLRGITPAQTSGGSAALAAPPQHGRAGAIRSLDAGPVSWKYDSEGNKKFVTGSSHISQAPNIELQQRPGRVEKKGPSPHQTHISPPGGAAEHKRYSPGPPSAFHTASQASSSSVTTSSHQQPIRYSISASSLSPSGPTEANQTIPLVQHKAPSPKPQHRHKDMSALQHTIQHPPTGVLPGNLAQNIGPIRQPVVSLVKLEDVKHQFHAAGPIHTSHDSQFVMSQGSETRQEVVSHRPHALEQVATSSQRVPFSQLPPSQQVNPFTFPPKAIISQATLSAYHQHKTDPHQRDRRDFISKGGTPPPNVSLHQEYRATDRPDEMPRLDPISPRVPLEDSKPKDLPDHDLLEKTAEYVTMKNPFNMRIVTLGNLPTTSLYRSTYRAHSVAVHRAKAASIVSAPKSLDLLRQTLQKCINKEIDLIIQQYMEKFFKPGIENIKVNNGSNAVSEEHVQAVCRQILEEAKKMYLTDHGRQSITPTRDIPDNLSDAGSTGSKKMPFQRKRKASDTDSEKSHSVVPKRKKGRPPLYISGRSTPSKLKSNEPVRREGPKWDHERITINSQFIMGARANKALGLGATRGRIYIKHPELFKYSGDQDDKQWLYENHHMPATGGKAYMLLLEDVKELANDDEYRDNSNLLLNELVGFTITDWMIEKVKAQMIANRTDNLKKANRSRSTTPSEVPTSVPQDDEVERDEHKTLPFSSFTNTKALQLDKGFQNSPSGDTEMEFLSGGDNDDHTIPGMSPFNITGGFDDGTSPSPSDLDPLDDDTPLSATFELTN